MLIQLYVPDICLQYILYSSLCTKYITFLQNKSLICHAYILMAFLQYLVVTYFTKMAGLLNLKSWKCHLLYIILNL